MSHITTGVPNLQFLDLIKEAALAHGATFHEGQRHHRWYGRFVGDTKGGGRDPATMGQCDHAIRLPKHTSHDYEVGVVRESDGTYSLVYDSWGPGERIERVFGKGCKVLGQEYNALLAERTLQEEGYATARSRLENGDIQVHGVCHA